MKEESEKRLIGTTEFQKKNNNGGRGQSSTFLRFHGETEIHSLSRRFVQDGEHIGPNVPAGPRHLLLLLGLNVPAASRSTDTRARLHVHRNKTR